MKIPNFKRLNKNDYPEEFRELVDKLSYIINDGFESVYSTLDGRVSTENKLEVIKEATFQVNEDGIPQARVNCTFAGSRIKKAVGCLVISVTNVNNPVLYPEAGVTPTWVQEGESITITHLTGLQANSPWLVRFLIIGSG